ncbi:hypothetical protein L2E82_06793 [Cichorium intybus]|uniref:Uncharacterized protein n=1 Tax=Cichorium intybus TaxID=13427 RepID=A0ACB9HC37_CICIN|nr:hypothetical protein L2E82_06793 [Cichorium intybus]
MKSLQIEIREHHRVHLVLVINPQQFVFPKCRRKTLPPPKQPPHSGFRHAHQVLDDMPRRAAPGISPVKSESLPRKGRAATEIVSESVSEEHLVVADAHQLFDEMRQ